MLMLLTLGLLVPFCAAQVLQDHTHNQQPLPTNDTKINAKPKKRGPRALAVVEFLPGGKARLVPVALWIDDRYYDASLYGANPEPMALEPETVYEATNYGEPTGLFTIQTAEQVKGNWVAMGQWKPHLEMDEKLAEQKAKQPKLKPKGYDVNSDRPVLKRSGDSSASSQGSSGSSSTTQSAPSGPSNSSPEPPDRPILKKPEPPPDATPATTAAASSTPSPTPASSASPDEGDPNRPVLRRGPQPKQPVQAASSATGKPGVATAASSAKPATAAPGQHSYPAISDAGAYETRSLMYSMDSAERNNKSQQLRALAMDELGKFIAKRKTPALPKAATISDYDLRAYDLDFSNSPTFVLTATLPVAGAKALRGGDFEYYVTVVAREDINGVPIKIFGLVSDSNHLDAFPRLEVIDAVDADANGRGDLLFRDHSDSGISYSLYRVYPYDMQKVFEGGAPL